MLNTAQKLPSKKYRKFLLYLKISLFTDILILQKCESISDECITI